jgi:phosphotransacetylase
MNIKCLKDLAASAASFEEKPVVVVVEAHDGHTVESVAGAAAAGIVRPVFIGNLPKISKLLGSLGTSALDFERIPSDGVQDSLRKAAELIHAGEAAALMKGSIETSVFMKGVLNERNDLLAGGRLSLAGVFETPGYHKLFVISDMGVNTYPDFECKRVIVENAVFMLNKLGNPRPKVAILAAIEKLNPKMPDTVDADALKKMNEVGKIGNCIVEGPISFDLATSAEAAEIKGYKSPVAGDADLLVVPDLIAGNILAKCVTGMAGGKTAGTVLGAKVPIILTSRSAAASDKYNSMALAACLGS